jgi:VWFA-related protein
MRQASHVLGAVIAVAAIAALPAALTADSARRSRAQEAPLIRAGVDLVHFDVIVTDKKGAFVHGLSAEDFEVVEEGTRQTLSVFAAGDRDVPPDLHLGILVDVSGSMGDIEDVRRITVEILNRLPEATDYTLVVVGDDARVAHFARPDFDALIDRIRRLKRRDSESTALWDGFRTYLRETAKRPGRHALVAFTDGRDTSSTASFEHIRNAVRASPVTIFGVGFGHSDGSAHGARMSRIADETGGITMFPHGPDQMQEVHRRIVTEIRSPYSLGYVSTDDRRDGRWREVTIRLVQPEHKELRIRTRDGYFAPRRAS